MKINGMPLEVVLTKFETAKNAAKSEALANLEDNILDAYHQGRAEGLREAQIIVREEENAVY